MEEVTRLNMGSMSGRIFTLFLLTVVICLHANFCHAQIGGMDAEFAGGGARALAMGGAFIALADDATAVEFNPAGLWQLRTPEIAFQTIYTYNRHTESKLSDSGIERYSELDLYVNPSFLSIVYPMQGLTVGVSRFTNVYFKRSFDFWLPGAPQGRVRESCRNYAYGLTFARGISNSLSAGLTLRYNDFRFTSDTDSVDAVFRDKAPSANVGIIWRATKKFRLGCVYKSQQKMRGKYGYINRKPNKIKVNLPDTLGVGLAFLPNKRLRFVLDVDHIWWSKFDPSPKDDFVKDNVWRYHVGGEYYAGRLWKTGIFVRGGYFYEEPNSFRYTASPDDDTYNSLVENLASRREAIQHYTFGLGFAREDYQLDFGVDYGDDTTVDFIASMVYYFK